METELEFEFLPYIRAYKNGRVERLKGTDVVPAGTDPDTGVLSKDVTNIIPETEVYARIYLPKLSSTNEKLPLLVYYHGGAFLVHTPSSPLYHNFLNALVHESRVITVSVHYRRAPEHHLPVAYEDSWATLHWVASHCNGDGPEPMLNHHADFQSVFLAGDSAGGNIVHNLAMAAGQNGGLNVGIRGAVLIDPYFWGSDPIGSEGLDMEKKAYVDRLWNVVCPSCPLDDPWINPMATGGMSLAGLGCWRVLVTVAEKDLLKDRGWLYFQALAQSGWLGAVEIHETQGEDHCFHLDELEGEKAKQRLKKIAEFFKMDLPPMAFQ
ncbi:probable carboxylesterase 2 [Salvia hispanica]|uniref:probable carboxylesterase 2 n=1 Tax=Salvia hispanica TaxID=49212 RepID=UPI00200991A8|nr:probable carboxylesterase 2 [Salvia hispanica]